MEKETNYIERLIKNISNDKNRLMLFIFSTLSVICSLIYVTSVNASGTHLIFVLTMLGAAATNILYAVDTELKFKYTDDCAVFGIAAMILGAILKVIRTGFIFSGFYLMGYFCYVIAFLILELYCIKNEGSLKIVKLLLLLCATWSVYEFFSLSSSFITGIVWKIFRMAEAFLAISYIFFSNIIRKYEVPFADKLGDYKNQVPAMKICISIALVIAVVSGAIGFIMNFDKNSIKEIEKKTVTVENAVTEEKAAPKKTKKSTVISTVVPSEETPAEAEEIKIGDSIETDSFTLKLNKVEISRRVEPDNPPSYYTYYQAEDEHSYIYINASVTNKEKHSIECDEIYSVTADFDGGYEYKGFSIADDYDGDFTYANITSVEPLETLGVHCLIDCPRAIEEEGKPLFITINLKNGSKYKYVIK